MSSSSVSYSTTSSCLPRWCLSIVSLRTVLPRQGNDDSFEHYDCFHSGSHIFQTGHNAVKLQEELCFNRFPPPIQSPSPEFAPIVQRCAAEVSTQVNSSCDVLGRAALATRLRSLQTPYQHSTKRSALARECSRVVRFVFFMVWVIFSERSASSGV